jgi:hypothetical protein
MSQKADDRDVCAAGGRPVCVAVDGGLLADAPQCNGPPQCRFTARPPAAISNQAFFVAVRPIDRSLPLPCCTVLDTAVVARLGPGIRTPFSSAAHVSLLPAMGGDSDAIAQRCPTENGMRVTYFVLRTRIVNARRRPRRARSVPLPEVCRRGWEEDGSRAGRRPHRIPL